MRARDTGQPQQKVAPQKKFGGIAVNFLGILGAFAIVFGGLSLVQGRLSLEQEKLLSGSGLVELPQADSVETAGAESVSLSDPLTEEELMQLAENLKEPGEAMPHEPLPGQLTMLQAIDCGQIWLEKFFLPYVGMDTSLAGEFATSCYLWAPESAGGDLGASPWLSCWTIYLNSQEINAAITINAKSGQILDASVRSAVPVSYQTGEALLALLGAYADSFGMQDDYCLVFHKETESGQKKLPYYQSIGTQGLYAAIEADNIMVSTADATSKISVYKEWFQVRLYICTGSVQYLQD